MLLKGGNMESLDWLLSQNLRTDDIGWISRLIQTSEASQNELRKQANLSNYIETLSRGKIRQALLKGWQEWSGQYKKAGRPLLGIFWIVNGEVIPFTQDADSIQVAAGFKDVAFNHYDTWHKIQKVYPAFRDLEYDQVSRGRVIGVGPDRFRIFLSPTDAVNKTIVNRILGVFSLPIAKTEVMADNHYIVEKNKISELFDEDPFD